MVPVAPVLEPGASIDRSASIDWCNEAVAAGFACIGNFFSLYIVLRLYNGGAGWPKPKDPRGLVDFGRCGISRSSPSNKFFLPFKCMIFLPKPNIPWPFDDFEAAFESEPA